MGGRKAALLLKEETMYKFLRNVSTMTGKSYRAGGVVPEGAFHALDEMVKAGDIAEVVAESKNETPPENNEQPEVPVITKEEKRLAALEKARATRAANKANEP